MVACLSACGSRCLEIDVIKPDAAQSDTQTLRTLGTYPSLFGFHHGSPHVMPTLGADCVCRHRGTALRAECQLLGRFMIVRPAAAGLLVRLSPFWDGHVKFLSSNAL